ncbi:hypothetical protein [Promicromonospora sp. NPDC059942]|uniref:hypothetical protein n=1 Tax=Promicromonospora sp. NPDC059942 TaxID=3347009 RepID=UPI00365B0CD1
MGSAGAVVETATDSLDPTFVQEGTPSTNGGQVVRWGDLGGTNAPPALPPGVFATALTSDSFTVLVLRSDGNVDWRRYHDTDSVTHHLQAPPNTKYTAISTGGTGEEHVLRSDGVVVDLNSRVVTTPPEGLRYTAIAPGLALRSDGVLEPSGTPEVMCPDASDPGPGLRYTAISARDSGSRWVALRGDGAFVYCRVENDEPRATVFEPPADTRFIGVDMGQVEAVAATADGRIISSENGLVAVAPTGRSIVSLAAIRYGRGAAALDDGTILSWGLSGKDAAPPVVPAERAVFSAVTGQGDYGQHWAIMVGDPIPVEVSVLPMLPADRPLRVTDHLRVNVAATLGDGTPITGLAETTVRTPDGQERALEAESLWPSSTDIYLMPRDHAQVGSHDVAVTFSGSPYATTTIENTFDFVEPSPVALTTSGPRTWRQGSEDTLCFTLDTEDGSPLWRESEHQTTISVDGDPGQSYDWYQPNQEGTRITACLHDLSLEPGTYTARFTHEGWGEADSPSWSGEIVVLAPPATRIESNLPLSWHYGQMPDLIGVDVRSDSLVPAGVARLYLDDRAVFAFGYSAQLDGTGHGWIRTGDEDELVPGTYPMVLKFRADGGFLDSQLKRTVTVKPATFTTATPTIIGTPQVGAKLTAATGIWSPTPSSFRYAWKVAGVAVAGATSSTFTVPASAAGKKVTVTVTGLKQYYESSATSAPTSAVAPGTFTAPKPTIKGTAKVGATLTATRGTWSPTPSSVKYVWKANGTTISTRTSSTFVVPASAKGKRLTVTVIGTRTGYTTRSVASSATSTVAAGTFTAPRPTITGTKRVGSTLTVSRGTWSPAPSSVKYVWKADGATISTRTSNRFVIPARARGKHLTVTVTGSRAGYTTRSVTSTGTVTIR